MHRKKEYQSQTNDLLSYFLLLNIPDKLLDCQKIFNFFPLSVHTRQDNIIASLVLKNHFIFRRGVETQTMKVSHIYLLAYIHK